MITANIALLIVTLFLLLTLVIGLLSNRKITTFEGYAVGDKRFSTAILVATLLATVFDGKVVYWIMLVHQIGNYAIIGFLIGFISFWIVSLLALHMFPFMRHLSVAETMGKTYGKYPRVITALSNICIAIPVLAIQINTISFSISMCVDSANADMITLYSTLIFIVYTILGGIRAVTLTDVLQFITFTIIMGLLAKFMFAKAGKTVLEMVAFLPTQKKMQFGVIFHFDGFDYTPIGLIEVIFCKLLLCMGYATVMQRVYMASGPVQVKKVFLYASFFYLLISLTIIFVGLFVFVKDPELSITEVWNYILANVPSIFKGCIAICLLGLAMSTADSYLHVCSVMVSHDIMESIWGVNEMPYRYKIRLARGTSLVLGLVAMIVAFYCKGIEKFPFFYLSFHASVVTVPFLLAVLGFRGSTRTALIGMTVGTLAILVWDIWVNSIRGHYFAGTFASGLAMMAAHYLLPQPPGKGWVGLDDRQKRMRQLMRAFKKYKERLELD